MSALTQYKIKLLEQLELLNLHIASFEMLNEKVSQKNIGWHIQHALLVINEYIDGLGNSNPEHYKWKFNFLRTIVLATKFIPRYYGKAPISLLPTKDLELIELKNYLATSKLKIEQLNAMPKNSFVDHPVFYKLNFLQAIDYLVSHNKHHLKIINDILKN